MFKKTKSTSFYLKNILSGLVEFIIDAPLVSLWGMTWIMFAGLLEIIFKLNIFLNPWVLTSLLLLMIGVGLLLYTLFRRRYKRTAGESIVASFTDAQADLRPLGVYCKAIILVALVFFLTRWITGQVFGSMAQKQVKVLTSMGATLEPKSYFPSFDTLDNAAPFLMEAMDSLDGSTVPRIQRLFGSLSVKPDTIAKVAVDINELLRINKEALTLVDDAVIHRDLAWDNYREIPLNVYVEYKRKDDSRMKVLLKLSLLDGIWSGFKGDWVASDRAFCRAVGIVRLQNQEPSELSTMAALAEYGIICDGLATFSKVSPDKAEGLAIVNKTLKSLPPIAGNTQRGIKAGLIWMNAFLTYKEVFIFNMLWPSWGRYCWLKYEELSLKCSSPDNNAEKLAEAERQCQEFMDDNTRLPAGIGFGLSLNPAFLYRHELEARAKPGAVMLFSAAVAYRSKQGTYPANLQQLVPAFLTDLPKSPMDHKDYVYATAGDFMEVYVMGKDGKHIPSTTCIGTLSSK